MMERCALIVEPSQDLVSRLETVLEEFGYISVCCDSAAAAARLTSSICPNLVLIDLDQPTRDSLTLLGTLREQGLQSSVLWFADEPSSQAVERVRASGAQGLIRKDSDSATLKFAIRTVLCGDLYFSPQLTSPATPGAKAVAESQRLLKVLQQARKKQG